MVRRHIHCPEYWIAKLRRKRPRSSYVTSMNVNATLYYSWYGKLTRFKSLRAFFFIYVFYFLCDFKDLYIEIYTRFIRLTM